MIVDMVAFLYSVVGVEYERNTAGFIQWLVLSMKETLHVPGVLLPKSHIAAFINVVIENNVARLYGIDFNPYQPVFKFKQFVHVIERSRKKKDTLFDCPVRLFKITDIIYTGLSISFTDILSSCGNFEACGMHLFEA